MMRETAVHKFSDGTLTRIVEKLDVMVKDYVLFKFNLGEEHRILSEDDKRRSQEFIKLIVRKLKIRRIFKSLESFVSGSKNRRDLPRDNPLVSVEVLRSIWELTFLIWVSHAHYAALPVNERIPCQNKDVLDTIMSDSEDSTVTYTTVSSPYEGRSGDVSQGVDGPLVMLKDPYAYVVATFQALHPPDYVPGLEEPEQAPPSPVYIPYVPEPMYPEYIPPEDDVFPAEEPPLPAAASPTAESPGYIPEFELDEDPKENDDEDPEEDPADYPVDHDDEEEEEEEPSGDDADEEDEEQDEDDEDEEEVYPASADSIPPPHALRVTARISFRPQPLTLSFTKEDTERFLAMPIPLPSPLTLLSSPLPQIPSLPLPASPLILSIPLPTASPPLQLLSSDRRADRPEVTLPPRKRLSIVHYPGYKAGESSVAAAARPIEGHPRDVAEEGALTTLEGVNTRVTELAAVQEQDTQDIYEVMEDTQGRKKEIFQRFEALGHLATALGEIRALQAREQARTENGTKESGPRRTTKLNPGATSNPNQAPSTTTTTVTNAQLQAMIDQGVNVALAAHDANRTELKKKMADKYFSRNEIKKIETEFWNLDVQGTDVTRYNQCFQELALLCVRTCSEESDRVERYIGGLPDSIYGSVTASKPKTMQEATEMATGLMDKKIRTYA
nr:reverse transcriptase domain-containing protein [Tanacetum cinerariifolium]